jgi:hypothetical protein
MNTLEDAYIDIARQEEHLLANLETKNSQNNNRNGPHEKYKKTNDKL